MGMAPVYQLGMHYLDWGGYWRTCRSTESNRCRGRGRDEWHRLGGAGGALRVTGVVGVGGTSGIAWGGGLVQLAVDTGWLFRSAGRTLVELTSSSLLLTQRVDT